MSHLDQLVSDHERLQAENLKLQAEVNRLRELQKISVDFVNAFYANKHDEGAFARRFAAIIGDEK